MVLLQDWSSEERLSGPLDEDARDIGHTPSLDTNRNLQDLLFTHFGLALREIYATNLFPFIKPGPMDAEIPMADLVRAAKEFALPQIEIVEPRISVCLGLHTFNAVRAACGARRVSNIEQGVSSPFSHGVSQIWCQAHTGRLGKNNRNRGGVDRVSQDWARMAQACNKAVNPSGGSGRS
jgi:restriction system protein